MKSTWRTKLLTLCGVMMMIASALHGFVGITGIHDEVLAKRISAGAAPDLYLGWLFSAMNLFLVGLWLLLIALQVRTGRSWLRFAAIAIGSGMLIFGGLGVWYRGAAAPHLAGFALVGLLILITGIGLRVVRSGDLEETVE